MLDWTVDGAAVNGGHGYCPDDDSPYSNQAICYSLHTCVDERLDESVEYVWLGNPVDVEVLAQYGPWARKGIHEGDFDYEALKACFVEQEIAKGKWKSATWTDLGEAITTALEAKGLAVEAGAIVRFLTVVLPGPCAPAGRQRIRPPRWGVMCSRWVVQLMFSWSQPTCS